MHNMSTGSVQRTIPAPAAAIYAAVTDLGRMGEWSPECVGVDVDGPVAVGARFTGHNSRGGNEWSTPCTVTAAEPDRRFAFVAGDDAATSTTWVFEIEDLGDGSSAVTQSFDAVRLRHPDWAEQLDGRHAQLVADMASTLDALAEAVAS